MSTGYKISEKDGAYFLTFQIVGWVEAQHKPNRVTKQNISMKQNIAKAIVMSPLCQRHHFVAGLDFVSYVFSTIMSPLRG
jgi:hypothetical protein